MVDLSERENGLWGRESGDRANRISSEETRIVLTVTPLLCLQNPLKTKNIPLQIV